MKGLSATPIVDEEIILLALEKAPNIRLINFLLIHRQYSLDILFQILVPFTGVISLVVYHHVGDVLQSILIQFLLQVLQTACLFQTEMSGSLE